MAGVPQHHFPDGIEAIEETLDQTEEPNYQAYSQFSYGAAFIGSGCTHIRGSHACAACWEFSPRDGSSIARPHGRSSWAA